jgi:hypothetical protein
MNQPPTEAWAAIARLQNARAASTNEAAIHALDLMIDGQIDCIAANHTEPDHLAEAGRRAIATAARRERHRARLMRLYLVGPSSDNRDQFFTSTLEAGYSARQALSAIFAQTSPQDAALLLSVGKGEAPQAPGLTAATARKRLSRLRARFSHLNLQAA